jgi:hypothetical protein
VIENVWGIVKARVEARNPKNIDDIQRFMLEEWNSLDQETINRLIAQTINRFRLCILEQGGYIGHLLHKIDQICIPLEDQFGEPDATDQILHPDLFLQSVNKLINAAEKDFWIAPPSDENEHLVVVASTDKLRRPIYGYIPQIPELNLDQAPRNYHASPFARFPKDFADYQKRQDALLRSPVREEIHRFQHTYCEFCKVMISQIESHCMDQRHQEIRNPIYWHEFDEAAEQLNSSFATSLHPLIG